jgi:hypothetical protein
MTRAQLFDQELIARGVRCHFLLKTHLKSRAVALR